VAIIDTLYHRGPDRHVESWLPMDEVLRRVAARFPLVTIDRERGDRRVVAEADNLVELGMSPTSELVELHRKMVGRVAYVTIREDDNGPRFDFFLTDHPSSIDIDYEHDGDREGCRRLLHALTAALPEYDLVSEDPEEPSDLVPDDMPAAVRDAISGMHLRWEGGVAILAAGAHEAGEPFPQESGSRQSRHWCDDSTDLILDLAGFASVPSQDLIEWVQVIEQTAAARGRDLRLCYPPGTVDERLTKYFRLVMLPIHASLAEALAAREESVG
jgi:hypothetical protein